MVLLPCNTRKLQSPVARQLCRMVICDFEDADVEVSSNTELASDAIIYKTSCAGQNLT